MVATACFGRPAVSSDSPIHRRILNSIPFALAARYACHSAMLAMALINETTRHPSLRDRVLEFVPRIEWVAENNYRLWIASYLPVAIVLWRVDRERFIRLQYASCALSLLRGVCILATGLGPVDGVVGGPLTDVRSAWLGLVNPFQALFGKVAHVSLTQDLFFSGHTASTFVLYLYCRAANRRVGYVALAAHVVVVASVFLAHLHYTIDVVGAWGVTFCVYGAIESLASRSAGGSVR